jgi:hypothetical protein
MDVLEAACAVGVITVAAVSIFQARSIARVNRELLAALQEQKTEKAYQRWLLALDVGDRRTYAVTEYRPELRPFVARAIREGRMIEVEPGVVRAV